MFWIELIISIKMDLALNNLQRFTCHKTQTTQSISPPQVSFPSLWGPFQGYQPRFLSPVSLWSIAFSSSCQEPNTFPCFLWLTGTTKFTTWQVLYLSVEIECFVRISKSQRILWISLPKTDSGLFVYHLLAWWTFNLLHSLLMIPPIGHALVFLFSKFTVFAYI